MHHHLRFLAILAVAAGFFRLTSGYANAEVINVTATVEPVETADVTATVNSTIVGLTPATAGSTVEKGDILARLDPLPFEVALEKAKADLAHSSAALTAAKAKVKLVQQDSKHATSQPKDPSASNEAELEFARADVDVQAANISQAEAAVDAAKLNLAACQIRSPIRGRILDQTCKLGQTVGPGSDTKSLFLIGDVTTLKVWTQIDETDIPKVAKGQPAKLALKAYPGVQFTGHVTEIHLNAAKNNQSQVKYTVLVDIDKSDVEIIPYLTADVSIDTGK